MQRRKRAEEREEEYVTPNLFYREEKRSNELLQGEERMKHGHKAVSAASLRTQGFIL